jgi:hypothetical protein
MGWTGVIWTVFGCMCGMDVDNRVIGDEERLQVAAAFLCSLALTQRLSLPFDIDAGAGHIEHAAALSPVYA